jgi:hypothetical protein
MRKKKADEEPFKTTLLVVQKEMAKPTIAKSARRKKAKRVAARNSWRVTIRRTTGTGLQLDIQSPLPILSTTSRDVFRVTSCGRNISADI